MKKKTGLILIALFIALSLVSCKGIREDAFYDISKQASGGVIAPEQGMNIKDIDISYFQEQTEIALHIVYGSREETQSEAIVTDLPKYEVFLLDEPYRLAIRLYGIEYVDYIEKASWALDEHVIGVFRERVSDKDYTTVYFQLNTLVKFRVDEGDGKIRIILESDKTEPQNHHFVMLNAYDEYLEGILPEGTGLTPVLCADRQNIAMISKPYKSNAEAESRRTQLQALMDTSPVSKTPYTMTLAGEILPIINLDIDQFVPAEKKMVIVNNAASTLPVLFENGKYAASFDKEILFVKPYRPTGDEPAITGEELWILSNGDRQRKLDLPPFTAIQNAGFSASGRYIGLIDVTVDSKVLYVYDLETDTLYNLGEEGFGNITSSFTWANDGDALYAITGNETLNLARCAFIEGGLDVQVISESVNTEGKIADFNNQIVFADNFAGEHGIIYSVDKFSGEKAFLTEGVDFKISPDGKNMAVLEYNDFGEENAYVNLKQYAFSDQSETMIAQGGIIESFDYLPSSDMIVYADGTKSDYTYQYLYALELYDTGSGVITTLAQMATGKFYLTSDGMACYLIDFYLGDDGRYIYTTYTYQFRS